MSDKRIFLPASSLPVNVNRGFPLKWIIIASVILVSVLVIVAMIGSLAGVSSKGKIAVIRIFGPIGGGDGLFGKPVSSDEIVGMINRAGKESGVNGILVEINSPGGSPVSSEEIMKAVRDSEKPTVALIRDLGASGGYWIASGADYIVASPVSLTGSVGVTAAYLQFSGFFDEHGINYERIVSGKYKDLGTPYRNLTDDERKILLFDLVLMHKYFLDSVTENRQITDNESILKIATARVFLGGEAKELGLVDELGGKKEAEAWLKGQTGLKEIKYVSYEKKHIFGVGSLLAQQSSRAGAAFGGGLMESLTSQAKPSVTT